MEHLRLLKEKPTPTTATTHSSGAKVFGSYLATAVGTTVQTGAQPPTETQYNSINSIPLVSNASSTETGGRLSKCIMAI